MCLLLKKQGLQFVEFNILVINLGGKENKVDVVNFERQKSIFVERVMFYPHLYES